MIDVPSAFNVDLYFKYIFDMKNDIKNKLSLNDLQTINKIADFMIDNETCDEISRIIIRLGDDIIDDLTLNWKEYDIKNKVLLDYIVDSVLFPSYTALKRALKQNEKNWLNRTVVESIQSTQRPMLNKKEGF